MVLNSIPLPLCSSSKSWDDTCETLDPTRCHFKKLLKISIFIYVCLLVYMCSHMCAGAFGDQKKVSDLLQLELQRWLWTARCWWWESNLRPLEEHPVPSTMSHRFSPRLFVCLFFKAIQRLVQSPAGRSAIGAFPTPVHKPPALQTLVCGHNQKTMSTYR